jgi:ferrous iron transport protein B
VNGSPGAPGASSPKQDKTGPFRMVLIGQPNCGKSTLFNEVAGYKSITSNFPGATVSFTSGRVRIFNRVVEIIDLPGVYSLTSLDPSGRETQKFMLDQPVDVIVNVMDASVLGRGLELTLQLLDLEIPLVLCLNMMDEAERKGIDIDVQALSGKLGVPVIAAVASRGRGVKAVLGAALASGRQKRTGRHISGSRDVERVISDLASKLKVKTGGVVPYSAHLLATKILERDPFFEKRVLSARPELEKTARASQHILARSHGCTSDRVIAAERHALSMALSESISVMRKPRPGWRDRLDDVLMHNFWGYVFLFAILFSFYFAVFRAGNAVEKPLLGWFASIGKNVYGTLPPDSLLWHAAKGVVDGIGGGVAIVLPYLLPFLVGLSIMEDAGYLPRVAFLMDSFMHRIGLHGTAVIPAVLGYGCNVPAVMAARILNSPRDRFIASLVATLVPCSARMTVVFGIVGWVIGGTAAFAIYMLNLAVIAASGAVLSRLLPEATPGMMLEIPAYQIPRLKTVLSKTWLRMKEFIVIAWPLLIAGSIVMTVSDHLRLTPWFNLFTKPVTWVLGLPDAVGITLMFGILRKELSMLMLQQALGTTDLATVLTRGQMLVFTVFVVFYVPCVATVGVLIKQIRLRRTAFIVLYTFFLALVLGFLTRVFAFLVWH